MEKARKSTLHGGSIRISAGSATALALIRILAAIASSPVVRLGACLAWGTTAAFIPLAPAGLQAQAPGQSGPRLVRHYKAGASELLGLSSDGQFLLTRGVGRQRPCAAGNDDKNKNGNNRATKCRQPVLAVYKARTGERVAELEGREDSWFSAAAFAQNSHVVSVIESSHSMDTEGITWDPLLRKAERQRLPLPAVSTEGPACLVADGSWLVALPAAGWKMALARQDAVLVLEQAPRTGPLSSFDCGSRIHGRSFLLPDASGRRTVLRWISMDSKPPALCRQFSEEIFNSAISPDGSLIVVVTGTVAPEALGSDVLEPGRHTTSVQVLSGSTCELLHSFALQFPEQPRLKVPLLGPKYWANARLRNGFALKLAVSPDNTKVALGYGVRSGHAFSNATAYFGIYSLQKDGRRMATVPGDVFRNGWWETMRMFDSVPTTSAPLTGLLQFSPDSQTLFTSSASIREWDLSGLR